MRKINHDEYVKLNFKSRAYASNPFIIMSRELEVNEGMLIEKGEWLRKNPPSSTPFNSKKLGTRFSVRSLHDNTGWAVLRVE